MGSTSAFFLPCIMRSVILEHFLEKSKEILSVQSIQFSLEVIRMFFPSFPEPEDFKSDPYSIFLARYIGKKYNKWVQIGNRQRSFEHVIPKSNWLYGKPLIGTNLLNIKPWILYEITTKLFPPPPREDSPIWKEQLALVKEQNVNLTEEQKEIIRIWGDFFVKGRNWIVITNDYLMDHPVSLEQTLFLRSVVTMAIFDALIVTFNAKYYYLVKPPYLEDPSIQAHTHTYGYPSYPSARAVISFLVADLLSEYFPDEKETWLKLAKNAADSRVWAGVNYPIGVEVGSEFGELLANRFFPKGKAFTETED